MTVAVDIHALDVSIAQQQVCKHLNLQLEPGMCLGILGRNGIGKTTLLKTIAGLHQADSGNIRIEEKLLSEWSHTELARKRSMLMQTSPALFNGTVIEAVLIGRHPYIHAWQHESDRDINIAHQTLDTVGLSDFYDRQLLTLSGGEYRRVEVARMLAQDTDIMLLDEPISHLDMHYQVSILSHLQTLCERRAKAMIMILHDPNLAMRYCDQLLLLTGNGEHHLGKPDELMSADILQKLYQHPVHIIEHNGERLIFPV